MKYPILFLSLALLPVLLSAQYHVPYRIMAKNGLRLRSAASQQAAVLTVVPYGDTVDVVFPADMRYLSNDQYLAYTRQWVVDTAGVAFTRNHYSGNDTRMTQPEPHVGYWWPASYAGQTGYLFSGFLWPVDIAGTEEQACRINELSGDYRLRREGGSGCSSNQIEWDNSFHWYALTVQNGICRLEKTGVRYLAMDRCIRIDCEGDYPGRFVYVRSDSRQAPAYLIGAKGILTERRFAGFCQPADSIGEPYWHTGVDTSNWLIYPNGQVNTTLLQASGLQLVLEKKLRYGALYDWYAVGRHGIRQKLEHHIDQMWPDGQLHPTLYQPFRLCFSGDLDGDGQTDYIVAFTHREQLLDNFPGSDIYLKLYLSSAAQGDEVVHPVAILGEFYCG